MSQSSNSSPEMDPLLDLPSLHRPRWRLWRTVIAIGVSLAIASDVAQLEQRLIPGLLDSPSWLAAVLYVGVICVPLADVARLVVLEMRTAYLRARWYNRVYRRAAVVTIEAEDLRAVVRDSEHVIEEQRSALARLSGFVEQAIWLAPHLHRALVVAVLYEDGRPILIAESQFQLRVAPGDLFVIVGQEPMVILGDFRVSRLSERGYHLRATRIQDNVWWASVRQAGSSGTLAAHSLIAILLPPPMPDLE